MPPKNVPGYGAASAGKVQSAIGGWVGQHAGRRGAPVSGPAQTRYVLRDTYGGSTKAMANAYGVSQRTVQRWLSGERNPARSPAGRRVGQDVTRIRERRAARHAKAAARRGQTPRVRIKGQIGPAPGAAEPDTETRRRRTISRDLTPEQTAELIDAWQARRDAEIQASLESAYGGYFNRGRPGDTPADIGQVDWIEFQ